MKLEILFDQDLNIAIIPGIVDIKSSTEINMIEVGRVIVNTLKDSSYIVDESELILLEQRQLSVRLTSNS